MQTRWRYEEPTKEQQIYLRKKNKEIQLMNIGTDIKNLSNKVVKLEIEQEAIEKKWKIVTTHDKEIKETNNALVKMLCENQSLEKRVCDLEFELLKERGRRKVRVAELLEAVTEKLEELDAAIKFMAGGAMYEIGKNEFETCLQEITPPTEKEA